MARIVLTQKQSFDLMKYMEEGYKAGGLNDVEFAAKATLDLKFPFELNPNHVHSARKSLGLGANASAGPSETLAGVMKRVGQLEELVIAQSVRIDDCIRKVETLQHDLKLAAPKLRQIG